MQTLLPYIPPLVHQLTRSALDLERACEYLYLIALFIERYIVPFILSSQEGLGVIEEVLDAWMVWLDRLLDD